eukprot:1187272-Prorocentrum_minimum.AAC.1
MQLRQSCVAQQRQRHHPRHKLACPQGLQLTAAVGDAAATAPALAPQAGVPVGAGALTEAVGDAAATAPALAPHRATGW